jgi:4-hydroxybenzoate polyprenyltransferase
MPKLERIIGNIESSIIFRLIEGLRIDSTVHSTVILSVAPLLCILLGNTAGSNPYKIYLFLLNMFFYISFAYMVNDYADTELDLISGKYRILGRVHDNVALTVIIFLFGANFAIWKILNISLYYLIILFIGLSLAVAYSAPPFRFKSRGLSGILIASIFGRALPIILACILYSRFDWLFALLIIFEIIIYIPGLIDHQICDYLGDKSANTNTAPVVYGLSHVISWRRSLSRIEILMALTIGLAISIFVPAYSYIFFAMLLLAIPAILLAPKLFPNASMMSLLANRMSFLYF